MEMIRIDGNMNPLFANGQQPGLKAGGATDKSVELSKTIKTLEKYLSQVDDLQQNSDMSVKDLLAGKNEDITSVVAQVAKADMSFKLLVGVRNKLIEAYKQTMSMQL